MTIAMSAYCAGGIVLCTDSNIIYGDQKWQGLKIAHTLGKTGSFAVASSSEDVDAGNTLVGNLIDSLNSTEIKDRKQLESLVTSRMSKWAKPFLGNPPKVGFILASYINGYQIRNEGLFIHYCEPPNTMILRKIFDDHDGFIGIGTGSAITNPLFKTLFSSLASAKARLTEFAYLMYRAEKNDAWCGGPTIAVVLKAEHIEPMRINPMDMQAAKELGHLFDFLLRTTGAGIIPQPDDDKAKKFSEHIASMVFDLGAKFRQLKFRALDGTEITY
jgi:hypothetical protein